MTKSRENLNKALAFDPKMGKAYIFMAQLYSDAAEERVFFVYISLVGQP